MSYDSTYEEIEAYLLNRMSEQEKAAFEAKVLADEKLAGQLEQQRVERKMMEVLVEEDLLKDLKRWEGETSLDSSPTLAKKARPATSSKKLLLGVVLLAIFIAVVIWILNKPRPDSTKSIQNQESQESGTELNQEQLIDTLAPQVDPTKQPPEKSRGNIADDTKTDQNIKEESPKSKPNYIALADEYQQAVDWENTSFRSPGVSGIFQNLKDHKYILAIDSLQAALKTDSMNLDYYYLIGMAYSDQKQFQEAIPYFERIIDSEEIYLNMDRVQWRLALAYLQKENVKASKELLNLITEDEYHKYLDEATKLLREINALSNDG